MNPKRQDRDLVSATRVISTEVWIQMRSAGAPTGVPKNEALATLTKSEKWYWVWLQTSHATLNATQIVTGVATRDAIGDATRYVTRSVKMEKEKSMDNQMVDNQVVEKLERFILECVEFSHNCLDGGNQWSGEGALLSFARDSLKLDIDWSRWRAYEELILRSGPRFVYKDFCVITDRFEYLHPADDQNRPHNADGPTHRYRCGTEIYHWHGLPVPRFWIMEKEKLDPSLALTHANAEMRRVVAEIVGWDRVLERLSPKTIDQDVDPEIGTLLEADLPEAPRSRFLKVQYTTASGVTKHYVLPVPNTMQTAIEANCWTYPGLTPELLRNRQARV